MDTEFLAALDDTDDQASGSPKTAQPFSPPSLSSSQAKQLELLQHLSLYSELLILICAEKGMGKTFIAKALLATRETPDQSLMLEGDFALSYLDILHNLAQFLDLADLADDIDSIEQQVLSQCLLIAEEDQGSILLIIDQSEQLSDDALEGINELALLAPSALHVMLLAPLGFENKLLALEEPQAPFHMMDIEPLTDDEAEILLLEQFPDKEWEADQADYIMQQSVGNPGKILYLAKQLLLGVKPQQEVNEATKFPVTHVAAIVLVALALIGTYFYQNSSTSQDHELMSEPKIIAIEAPVLKEAVALNIAPDVTSEANISIDSEKAEGVEQIEEVDFNFPQDDAVELASVEGVESDKSVSSKPATVEIVEFKKTEVIYSKDEQLLMSAANSAFVVQLFGSHSADNAQAFMNTHATKAIQLHRYRGEHNSKPWHVVIAGPFESREIALQQSQRLSKALRNQKPWIRSIADIQSVLISRK